MTTGMDSHRLALDGATESHFCRDVACAHENPTWLARWTPPPVPIVPRRRPVTAVRRAVVDWLHRTGIRCKHRPWTHG